MEFFAGDFKKKGISPAGKCRDCRDYVSIFFTRRSKRMLFNVFHKIAVFALIAFEFQRGMEDPVLPESFLDLLFHCLNLFHLPFAGPCS